MSGKTNTTAVTVNNTTADYAVNADGTVTITVNGEAIGTFSADQMTALVTVTLAGRKAGYAVKRDAREAANAAKKAEREAKKAERVAAAAAKKEAQIAKLQEKLAALSA